MANEFELVEHNEVNDLFTFVIDMKYRRPHLHTDIEIIYVLKGMLIVKSEEKVHHVNENQLIILNSCQLHELSSDNSALLLIFQYGLKQFEKSLPQIYELHFETLPVTISNNTQSQQLIEYLNQASQAYFEQSQFYSLLCHGLASLIMFELIHLVPHKKIPEEKKNRLLLKNERIRRISDYIHRNYQKKLLLSDIATKEELTVPYLSHFFTENFGLSFQDYLNTIRCEKAQHLLLHTSDSLLSISQACGFSDVRYLNKSFKDIYAITPYEFRKQTDKSNLTSFNMELNKKNDQQLFLSKEKSLDTLNHFFNSSNKS